MQEYIFICTEKFLQRQWNSGHFMHSFSNKQDKPSLFGSEGAVKISIWQGSSLNLGTDEKLESYYKIFIKIRYPHMVMSDDYLNV